MAPLWELTHDTKSAKVRYGSHVLMSRIFELCPSLIPKALRPLVSGLLNHLDDDKEQVASAACMGLASLVKVVYKRTSEVKPPFLQRSAASSNACLLPHIEKSRD